MITVTTDSKMEIFFGVQTVRHVCSQFVDKYQTQTAYFTLFSRLYCAFSMSLRYESKSLCWLIDGCSQAQPLKRISACKTSAAKGNQKKKKKKNSTVINVEQDRQAAAAKTTLNYRVLNQMLSLLCFERQNGKLFSVWLTSKGILFAGKLDWRRFKLCLHVSWAPYKLF